MDLTTGEIVYGAGTSQSHSLPCYPLETTLTTIRQIGFTYDKSMIVADTNMIHTLYNLQNLSKNNVFTTIGYSEIIGADGDGKIASLAYLNKPMGSCCDINGNIYIVDSGNGWIRRIDAVSGIISNVTNKTPIIGIIDIQVNAAGIIYALTPTQIYSISPLPSYYIVGSHYSIEGGVKMADNTTITLPNPNTGKYIIYFLKDMITQCGRLIVGNAYIYTIIVSASIAGSSLSLEYLSSPSPKSYNVAQSISNTGQTTITGTFIAITPALYFRITGVSGSVNITFTNVVIQSVNKMINTYTYAYNAPVAICGNSTFSINNGVSAAESKIVNARSIRLDSFGNIYISCSEEITKNLSNTMYERVNGNQTAARNSALTTLYGTRTPTDNDKVTPVAGVSVSNYTGGAAKAYAEALNAYATAQSADNQADYLNKLNTRDATNTLLDIMNQNSSAWNSISGYLSGLPTANGSYATGLFVGSQIENYIMSNMGIININSQKRTMTYIAPGSIVITNTTSYISLEASFITLIASAKSASWGYTYTTGDWYTATGWRVNNTNNNEILLTLQSSVNTIKASINTLKINLSEALSTAQSALDLSYTTHYGSGGTGALVINTKNALYGYLGSPTNITGGAAKAYLDALAAYTTLNSASSLGISTLVPLASETTAANNTHTGVIRRIDKQTRYITQYAGGFNECLGIAFDKLNNLYIVDHYYNMLYKMPVNTNIAAFQNVGSQLTTLQSNNYAKSMGDNKPYGIAIDSNNNIYISCNRDDVAFSSNAKGHIILKYNSSDLNSNGTLLGNTTAATAPYNYYGSSNPPLKNPQYLSIDRNNRILFTQNNIHSVCIIPTSDTIAYIQNVSLIRIEAEGAGKVVSLDSSYTFAGLSSDVSITITAADSTTPINLPYTSSSTNTSPFILFTLSAPSSITSIRLNATHLDSVGMSVLLYDSIGTLLSNRKTTNKILSGGCTISYDISAISDS